MSNTRGNENEAMQPTDAGQLPSAIESVIGWLPDVEVRDCEVSVSDGVVTIEGSVDTLWKKARVGEAVRHVFGVVDLKDRLRVVPTGTRSDEDIAREVEDALGRQEGVDADAVTVILSSGKATLSGSVPDQAAKEAVLSAAQQTPGVVEIDDSLSTTASLPPD